MPRATRDQDSETDEAILPPDLRRDADRAFTAEHERLYPRALRFAERLVGEVWARDLVDQTFYEIWKRYHARGEVPDRPMKTLVYTRLQSRIFDHLRRLTVHRQHVEDAAYVEEQEEHLRNREETERLASASLLRDRIQGLLATLDEETERLATLVTFEDKQVEDAAAEVGLNPRTARGRMARVKKKIMRGLRRGGFTEPFEAQTPEPVTAGAKGLVGGKERKQ